MWSFQPHPTFAIQHSSRTPRQRGLKGIAHGHREELIGMRERMRAERNQRALGGNEIGIRLARRSFADEHRTGAGPQPRYRAMP